MNHRDHKKYSTKLGLRARGEMLMEKDMEKKVEAAPVPMTVPGMEVFDRIESNINLLLKLISR
jgi:hypothetical protein